MTETKSFDKMLEFNIPVWVDFVFDKSWNWPEPSGTTKQREYENKIISPQDYWSFKVKYADAENTWFVRRRELAQGINAILTEQRSKGGLLRLAVMKFVGVGEDKKHYYCISDPAGFLMSVVPNHEIPQRFKDFVGVNGSALSGGAEVTPASQSSSAPPASPTHKTMEECINEAWVSWCAVLRFAYARKTVANDPDAEIRDFEFSALHQAMCNGLAQTAHTLFINDHNGR